MQVGKTYLVREPAVARARGFDTFIRIVEKIEDEYFIGNDGSIYSKRGEHQGVNREFDLVQQLPETS
jgi:hypothetical protein